MINNLSSVQEEVMNKFEPTVEGLTKREYFAAITLQAILKNSAWIEFSHSSKERGIIANNTLKVADENSKIVAEICVKYAEALLARLTER